MGVVIGLSHKRPNSRPFPQCTRIPLEVPNGGAGGNRTPVHKPYVPRSTYAATSIVLTAHYPTGRESVRPAQYFFVEHTPDTCVPLADERYTQTFASARAAWASTAIRRLERSCLDWQL